MATWYSEGTVSVANGSATVAGVGTAFVANVKIGEEFRLLGGAGYEVAAVVSNTELTLGREYAGTSQSGQAYEIVPVRGVLKSAYDALTSAIATMQGYIDTALSGLFENGSVGAPGIGFSGDTDTGFYRPGANEIGVSAGGVRRMLLTSSALTVDVPLYSDAGQAVSVTQAFNTAGSASGEALGTIKVNAPSVGSPAAGLFGGQIAFGRADGSGRRKATFGVVQSGEDVNQTGFIWHCYNGTTTSTDQVYPRMALSPWGTLFVNSEIYANAAPGDVGNVTGDRVVHHGNLLGTVSQDGGAPTGAVIERGSNANGEYTKFADGTMICTRKISHDLTDAAVQSWNYPAAFLGQPNGSYGVNPNSSLDNADFYDSKVLAFAHDSALWRTRGAAAAGAGTIEMQLTAIGRWY